MSHARVLVLVLGVAVATQGVLVAAEKEGEETTKSPEELLAESTEKTSVSGTFRFWQQTAKDGKPLPKVIGTLTGQGITYQVVVRDVTIMSQLASNNNQKVIVSGVWLNAGEKGAFLLADNLIESDMPPPTRTKRGGL